MADQFLGPLALGLVLVKDASHLPGDLREKKQILLPEAFRVLPLVGLVLEQPGESHLTLGSFVGGVLPDGGTHAAKPYLVDGFLLLFRF